MRVPNLVSSSCRTGLSVYLYSSEVIILTVVHLKMTPTPLLSLQSLPQSRLKDAWLQTPSFLLRQLSPVSALALSLSTVLSARDPGTTPIHTAVVPNQHSELRPTHRRLLLWPYEQHTEPLLLLPISNTPLV